MTHNCNNCEYFTYTPTGGICNAAKSDALYVDEPHETNACGDWVLINEDARDKADKELQAKVVVEKPPEVNDLPVRVADSPFIYANAAKSFTQFCQAQYDRHSYGLDDFADLREQLRLPAHQIEVMGQSRRLVSHEDRTSVLPDREYLQVMETIDIQKRFIISRFNIEPTQVLIHPKLYHDLCNIYRQGTYRELNSSCCPIKHNFDLNPIISKGIAENQVTVIVPVQEIMQ